MPILSAIDSKSKNQDRVRAQAGLTPHTWLQVNEKLSTKLNLRLKLESQNSYKGDLVDHEKDLDFFFTGANWDVYDEKAGIFLTGVYTDATTLDQCLEDCVRHGYDCWSIGDTSLNFDALKTS